ncbi:putative acyltransferase [Yarrowia sp. C11]|nr:putative acyltransferase [Yarrowia sp. C11]KAG5364954.1 putative acyltransferase [Yarrowia sp. E02]
MATAEAVKASGVAGEATSATQRATKTASSTDPVIPVDIPLAVPTTNKKLPPPRHSKPSQILRGIIAVLYFLCASVSIVLTQWIGYPLKYQSKMAWVVWVEYTKQQFIVVMLCLVQALTSTEMRVSGDETMKGVFTVDGNGYLSSRFEERAIVIANHQLYTDWIYLWWFALTSGFGGCIYILLKKSLGSIPILGSGMKNYNFILMSRKWAEDQQNMKKHFEGLNKLQAPVWLTLFPEGTNTSHNGTNNSNKFAAKMGVKPMKHVLLPRTTGLRFAIENLAQTVDYLYDCTLAYEGVGRGEYGQDFYTLGNVFLRGQGPLFVKAHWTKFVIKEIPYKDEKKFEKWLYDLWYDKDQMMDNFIETGKFFPDDEESEKIAKLQLSHPLQGLQVFVIPAAVVLILRLGWKYWQTI